MYDIAKKARAGMKAKAQRLAGEKDRKTDSSDWTPAPELKADVKTGMRPVSRQALKNGGVAGKKRADRKPRKAGGRVETKSEQPLVDRYINRDLKKANEYRDGEKHDGALKRGGRAKKAFGGPFGQSDLEKMIADHSRRNSLLGMVQMAADASGQKLPGILGMTRNPQAKGGRAKKADGGSAKYSSMEEMIKDNPAPKNKPLGLDKIPLPPRRPENLTTAVPAPKYKKDTDLNTQSYKDGGKTGEKWIQKAIKKPGALHKQMGVPEGEKIPAKKLEKAAEKGGKLGKRARLVQTLRSMHKDGGKIADKKCYGGRTKRADGGSLRSQFNEAFRNARAAGDKTFEWNGKKYTTELAKPSKSTVGSGPGSSRAGAPPMGAGPGSRSANVAAPAEAGPGSANPRSYTAPRVMGGGQGVTNRATPSVTTGTPSRDERYYEGSEPTNYGASLGNKRGGRIKKEDGGGMDPRLGIVKPKMLEFAQNVVTPGLKKGGRIKKEVGGSARSAGSEAISALKNMPDFKFDSGDKNIPPVGSGLLPQGPTNYEKPPVYDPNKYNPPPASKNKKGTSDKIPTLQEVVDASFPTTFYGVVKKFGADVPDSESRKARGGRAKKADGGSLRSQFNEAFRNARAAGDKTFEWNGKKYTTELAKPSKSTVGSGPGSSRAGAPPMGAGPGSRSANVAAPAEAGPGSANPRSYIAPRVMGGGQGVTNRATPSVTTGTPSRDERYYEGSEPTNYGASLGNKRGGRIKKQIGGALSGSMPAAAGTSVRQAMPPVGLGMMGRGPAPQAFANAQGRPFQGGQFMPPGLAKRMPQLPPQGMANLVTNPATPVNANPNPPTMYPGGNPNFNEGDVYNLTPPTLGGVASMPAPLNTATPVSGGVASMPAPLNASQARSYSSGTIGSGAYAKGGRVARASGGSAKSKGKGKTNINIVIATGSKKDQQPQMPQAQMGAMPPPPPPSMPMGAPPMPPAPMGGGMPPAPPMGGGQPPIPGAFKRGGRVTKVAKSYKDMEAGAASGEGRLQKTNIAKRAPKPVFEKGLKLSDVKNYPNKVPGATGGRTARKVGGKVYRSYKDMDAGAGSGKGRLEKTEIQSRKK